MKEIALIKKLFVLDKGPYPLGQYSVDRRQTSPDYGQQIGSEILNIKYVL